MKKIRRLLVLLFVSMLMLFGTTMVAMEDAKSEAQVEQEYKLTVMAKESDSKEKKHEETISGIQRKDGKIYYYEDGERFTDGYKAVKKDGKTEYYFFKKNGTAYTNGLKKVEIKGRLYYFYFGKNGKAYTEGYKKVKEEGKLYYYYFKSNGRAVTASMKKVKMNEKAYYFYFGENGRAITKKWKKIDSKTYYFGENGRAYTGKYKTISHYLCHFDNKGVLIRKIDKNKKMVALTYDDGPSKNTAAILKTLKKNDSVATFFVVGNRVPMFSTTVKNAYAMGCEIGNHTYEHKILTRCNAAAIQNQYKKTNRVIKKVTGENPVVFRPPGGAFNQSVRKNVPMPFIIWSVDTLDWKTRNSSKTISAVLNHVKDGDIVLMHDLYQPTATASKTIIPSLVKRGYQLVTVSELSACRGKMKNGSTYHSFRR